MKFFIYLLGYSIMAILSYIIPKENGTVVFIDSLTKTDGKFTGNHKDLYLYMLRKPSKLKPCWLTQDKNIFTLLIKQDYPVVLFNKVTLFWFLLRANFLITVSLGVQMPWGKFNVIQLWHGIGFKKIAVLARSKAYFVTKSSKKLLFIIASSDIDKQRKIDSFGNQRVIITGFPRNDIFFTDRLNVNEYKKNIGINANQRIILFALSFTNQYQFSTDFLVKLCDFLEEKNTFFLIKRHPLDGTPKLNTHYKYIRDVTSDIYDVQELLVATDFLITDYSSIVTDFALTERPILFYLYDNDKQAKSNNLYFDIHKITPGPFIYDENQLFEHLTNMAWFDDQNYKLKYHEFIERFHQFKDGNSSARVLDQILKLRN